eukprot:242559-Lingulodinium_polyedra.AAC.1
MNFRATFARKLLRNAVRNAFGCCNATQFAIHALHASTAAWWSMHGVRESRNALRRRDRMRV